MVLPTEFGEELVKDAHEISESEAVVGDHALDLVELCQMGGVQGFVSEHPVDGEILDRRELLLWGAADGLLTTKLPQQKMLNVKLSNLKNCVICGL